MHFSLVAQDTVETLNSTLNAISGLLVVVGFFLGLAQYKKSVRTSQLEFLAYRIREFRDNPSTRQVLRMLDWGEINIRTESGEERWVTNAHLVSFLRPHVDNPKFDAFEAEIRFYFSDFFDELQMLGHYLDKGMVAAEDLRPFIAYWLDILAARKESTGWLTLDQAQAIWVYVETYKYDGVKILFRKLGYEMPPVGGPGEPKAEEPAAKGA
jgi:hypothetical protein